jgi:excisionase family DNA binding protein
MDNQILTAKELAAWLKVEKSMVYRLVQQRKIPFFKIGSDYRFNARQIEDWMSETKSDD